MQPIGVVFYDLQSGKVPSWRRLLFPGFQPYGRDTRRDIVIIKYMLQYIRKLNER
jgi:hypothetical protein